MKTTRDFTKNGRLKQKDRLKDTFLKEVNHSVEQIESVKAVLVSVPAGHVTLCTKFEANGNLQYDRA